MDIWKCTTFSVCNPAICPPAPHIRHYDCVCVCVCVTRRVHTVPVFNTPLPYPIRVRSLTAKWFTIQLKISQSEWSPRASKFVCLWSMCVSVCMCVCACVHSRRPPASRVDRDEWATLRIGHSTHARRGVGGVHRTPNAARERRVGWNVLTTSYTVNLCATN